MYERNWDSLSIYMNERKKVIKKEFKEFEEKKRKKERKREWKKKKEIKNGRIRMNLKRLDEKNWKRKTGRKKV